MNRQTDDEREVLRSIWEADGQRLDIDEDCGPTKVCRNMKAVSFDGMAEPGTDLAEAWRDKLAQEGKLDPSAGTIADLVLGSADDTDG